MIDLNLFDRRFKVVETRNTGAAILQAFEDPFRPLLCDRRPLGSR